MSEKAPEAVYFQRDTESLSDDLSQNLQAVDTVNDESSDNHDVYPDGGTEAWLVAAGSAGVLFCTMGYVNSWGVYQAYYQTHQLAKESPSSIAWIGSLQLYFLFAANLLGGPLFDRYGAKIIRPAILLYVCSVMMTSICKDFWQVLLAQGFLGGIANGMVLAPALAATPQYFNKKRGAAMGIAIAGSSLGGVILPIALGRMLQTSLGFSWAVRILGFVFLTILSFSGAVIRARLPPRKRKFLLPAAFKDLGYVLLIVSGLFTIMGVFTPFVFLPTYAESNGMNSTLATYILAILNAVSLFGRVIPGVLSDKLGRLNMFIAANVTTAVMVFCWQQATSNAAVIIFAGFYGFSSGAVISGMTVCVASFPKNPQDIGTYMGMGMTIAAIGALVGPPINGAFITHYQSFSQVSYFSGSMTLLGAVIACAVKAMGPGGFFTRG